jgi:hypothetical protein
MVLSGCQNHNTPTVIQVIGTATFTTPPLAPTVSNSPEEWKLWSESPHAATNRTASAVNTYCAQCHSPLNWNPQVSRETAVVVSAGEWRNIPCEVCHEASETGFLSAVSWWDLTTQQNQPVQDETELCEKCHRDIGEFHYKVNLDDSVHASFGCIDCHDPHSTTTSCSDSGCHEKIRPESSLPPSTPSGGVHPNNTAFCGGANCHPAATQAALSNTSIHGSTHVSVSCIACHDASGMPVAPSQELGLWIPFRLTEKEGEQVSVPFRSHAIQREVDCSRCHIEGNEWRLPPVTGNEFGL